MMRSATSVDLGALPELRPLIEEVQRSGRVCVIEANGEEVARLVPSRPKRTRRGKTITAHDPIWAIVGIDASTEGPTDVSEHKQRYLAAPAPSHPRPK